MLDTVKFRLNLRLSDLLTLQESVVLLATKLQEFSACHFLIPIQALRLLAKANFDVLVLILLI